MWALSLWFSLLKLRENWGWKVISSKKLNLIIVSVKKLNLIHEPLRFLCGPWASGSRLLKQRKIVVKVKMVLVRDLDPIIGLCVKFEPCKISPWGFFVGLEPLVFVCYNKRNLERKKWFWVQKLNLIINPWGFYFGPWASGSRR